MGVTTIRASLNYIIIRREKKVRKDFREYFINTKGNYIYVIGINFSFYSIDLKIFTFY